MLNEHRPAERHDGRVSDWSISERGDRIIGAFQGQEVGAIRVLRHGPSIRGQTKEPARRISTGSDLRA